MTDRLFVGGVEFVRLEAVILSYRHDPYIMEGVYSQNRVLTLACLSGIMAAKIGKNQITTILIHYTFKGYLVHKTFSLPCFPMGILLLFITGTFPPLFFF